MSYPDKVYFGEAGEVSATFRPATTPIDTGELDNGIHYLATTETTRGEFGLNGTVRLLFTPGAPREEYFEQIAHTTKQNRAAFLNKHDSYFPDQP
ncbi:hypothetical protein OHA70_19725 [Kribbella sp. NBC_00382]|uniref:hypothetical protein n=1 Tax=Kribbella sp. NBC_00382 TaxID=2975967 RepID=UPI002E1B3A08